MTGEVTLAGRVLPIGGVKQKLLAAHRAGLTEVIIPARNEPDLDDLPDEVRAGPDHPPVTDVADVLRWRCALPPSPCTPPPDRRRLTRHPGRAATIMVAARRRSDHDGRGASAADHLGRGASAAAQVR